MANGNSSKGNPAHKRMSNPNMAARRARNWRDQEKRKDARRAAQAARERANKATVASGGLTPHQALNVANAGRVKVLPKPAVHSPIHVLVKASGNKGYYVGRVGHDAEVEVLRVSHNYGLLVAHLDLLNHWSH